MEDEWRTNDPMILRLHWGSYCALRHYATHACSSQLTRQPAKYSRRYSQGAANESANQAANEAAVRPADEACQRRSTLAKKAGNEAASSQSNRRRPFLPATSQLRRFSAHSAHDRRARTGPHVPARRRGGGSARRFRAGLPSGRRTRTNSCIFSPTFVLFKTSPFPIRAALCWWKHEAGHFRQLHSYGASPLTPRPQGPDWPPSSSSRRGGWARRLRAGLPSGR